jgi:hypothetical protein
MAEQVPTAAPEDASPPAVDDDVDDAPPHRGIEGRKGGCLIAFFGSMLLGGASIGLSWFILQARNTSVLAATSELADIMKHARTAKGADELRALGCDDAGVFELPALTTIAERLEEGRAKKEKRAPRKIDLGSDKSVVLCSMKRQASPTCEAVGKGYAEAAHPVAAFTVAITNLNGDVCAENYAPDGARLGLAKSPNLPPLVDPDRP